MRNKNVLFVMPDYALENMWQDMKCWD